MLDIVRSEDNLLIVIDKIRNNLASATTYAEILEVKDQTSLIYDRIKSEIKIAKKKEARDDIIKVARQTQGDIALMILRAESRLAKEYDLAKQRGEVANEGRPIVQKQIEIPENPGITTIQCDLGIDSRRLSEARKFNEFDEAHPGKAEEFVYSIIEEGEEPTKASINQKIKDI